jgi:CheY-like chemotaxis protein
LLIEDNADSAEMQKQVLSALGHEVWIAPNGPEGIQVARYKRPDLIFCDLGLPQGMSGYDVAKALAADADVSSIPLVALSGYGSPEDKRRAREAGFQNHLTKPVDIKTLQKVIAETSATAAS